MQNLNKKYKAILACLALGVLTFIGTMSVTDAASRTVAGGDGQETHGGKGTKTRRLIAGDGQETHGGKGGKTA